MHISWTIFLEQQLQWVYIIKLHSRYTTYEALCHGLITPYVHVLNIVELCICRSLYIEPKFFGFIIVNLERKKEMQLSNGIYNK